ncbi:MAG: ferric reductase-like transmembrane domain-containing protein [Sulfurimonas sp.]|nr:ferric reductase-like transmembrane domain-containing protein [Sulfurimonas sp.]
MSALFWITIYLLIVLAPLVVLNIGEVPPGSGFWWDFSMAMGFSGMAIMSVQFLLTARFKRLSAPFGIDIIYYFHRYLAIAIFMFVFLHYFIIRINYAGVLGVINPLEAPWYMTTGRVSLALLVLLIISSLFRKQLHIKYENWRIFHIIMAISAFLLALSHIEGVGYYIASLEKRWLWTLYTLFFVLLMVYIRLIKPWSMRKNPYKVVEIKKESENCHTLCVEAVEHECMQFKAGQFAWLTLKDSPYHIKEHPFSFSSSPEQKNSLEFTIKELGDFTKTIKDTSVGDKVYLDGPYGTFSMDNYPQAPGYVFIAAGVGVAPIISMLRTLAHRGDSREHIFLDINRNQENILFRKELEEIESGLNLKLIHLLSEPHQGWEGESCHISEALFQRILPDNFRECEYFICGPKPVSDAAQEELHAMKVSLSKIHFELFDMV